jgi:hypothetical protein
VCTQEEQTRSDSVTSLSKGAGEWWDVMRGGGERGRSEVLVSERERAKETPLKLNTKRAKKQDRDRARKQRQTRRVLN